LWFASGCCMFLHFSIKLYSRLWIYLHEISTILSRKKLFSFIDCVSSSFKLSVLHTPPTLIWFRDFISCFRHQRNAVTDIRSLTFLSQLQILALDENQLMVESWPDVRASLKSMPSLRELSLMVYFLLFTLCVVENI
jgi:hypothetical protein